MGCLLPLGRNGCVGCVGCTLPLLLACACLVIPLDLFWIHHPCHAMTQTRPAQVAAAPPTTPDPESLEH